MNYKSYSTLNEDIKSNIHKLKEMDIDLIIGIPRSGMIPAYMIALSLNLNCIDFPAFLRNETLSRGITRNIRKELNHAWEAKTALLVDDSISSGVTMKLAAEKLPPELPTKIIKMAVYSAKKKPEQIDLYFEHLPQPRVFEWNIYHHSVLSNAVVDMDGILYPPPTETSNYGKKKYAEYLKKTKPLFPPSQKIHSLITSRPEKYRKETEDWLAKHNIEHENLIMLQPQRQENNQKTEAHSTHKSDYYKNSKLELFIESDPKQAIEIAKTTGKPVFCAESNTIYQSHGIYTAYKNPYFFAKKTNQIIKNLLPTSFKMAIKSLSNYFKIHTNKQAK